MSLLRHSPSSWKGHREQEKCLRTEGKPVSLQSLKKGKKEDPGNYRLVSLTSVPGKVMEQFILDVICKQEEEKKVVRSSQHGFTKGKSCLTNLIASCDGITSWVDERRAEDVICFDCRAFDTVSHNIVLGKLG